MKIEDSIGICPICHKARIGDKDIEACIESHKGDKRDI